VARIPVAINSLMGELLEDHIRNHIPPKISWRLYALICSRKSDPPRCRSGHALHDVHAIDAGMLNR
jgi:hypothetical protein